MGASRTCGCYVAMVMVQLIYCGSNILIKISLERGLDQQVLIVYRHLIAMVLLGSLAYAFERKQHPPLSVRTLVKIFVLSAVGTTAHLNVYYAGLKYTTATVAGAWSNATPVITFAMAVIFRMEKVKIRTVRGQAQVLGILICTGGAITFTFWKDGYLFQALVNRPLINMQTPSSLGRQNDDWIKGSILILTSKFLWSSWFILQAVVCKDYPAKLSMNTLICFFGALQSSVLALIFDRKAAYWRLGWNVQLFTIVYCGITTSAIVYYLQTLVISYKGPVFAVMFNPVLLIATAIFSAVAFAERVHLGSVIAAIFIMLGLYCFLWGKKKNVSLKKEPPSKEIPLDLQEVEISIEKPATVNKTSEC